jgi:hypothetical protein
MTSAIAVNIARLPELPGHALDTLAIIAKSATRVLILPLQKFSGVSVCRAGRRCSGRVPAGGRY